MIDASFYFYLADKIKNPRSLISRIQGYPDPTLGIGEDEQNTDQLLLKKIRKNLDHDLLYTDDFERYVKY